MNTFQALLNDAYQALKETSDTPKIDAEFLLLHASKKSMAWLIAHADEIANDQTLKYFYTLLKKRQAGEPIAYLLGERSFWTLSLKVTPNVLIPRPDTEILVEQTLRYIPENSSWHILDLGTGSGAIALSIAKERPKCTVIATDKNQNALEIAEQNAKLNNINNAQFIKSNWFNALQDKQFELIVCNPPYIAENDEHLTRGDVRFEPDSALVSGLDGLDDIRILCKQAPDHLKQNGHLLLEHGYNQHQTVQTLLKENGFNQIETVSDLNQQPRVTSGELCK